MEKKKLIILLLVLALSLFFSVLSFAETITLKSGKTVEGKLIEKTDKYIKIDFQGVPVTYFMDEIDKGESGKSFPKDISSSKTVSDGIPQTAKGVLEKGIAFGKASRLDEAITEYNKAIELDPNYAEAYYNRGFTYYVKNNFDQSILDFNKAIELNPNYAEAYNLRAVAYSRKKEYANALEDMDKAEALGGEVEPFFRSLIEKASRGEKLNTRQMKEQFR